MPVNLASKNVPDEIVQRLRERAARNHRSLQGEPMANIEQAAEPERRLPAPEFLAEMRKLGLQSPRAACCSARCELSLAGSVDWR